FDVALGTESLGLLDLDLDPEALAVKAVLVALVVAEHGVVALVGVLVGAPPGVVHAHRVVGGNGAVEGGPARAVLVLLAEALEGVAALPELQPLALLLRKIDLGLHLLERHDGPLKERQENGILAGTHRGGVGCAPCRVPEEESVSRPRPR